MSRWRVRIVLAALLLLGIGLAVYADLRSGWFTGRLLPQPQWQAPAHETWLQPETARATLLAEYEFRLKHPVVQKLPAADFEGRKLTFADVQPIIQANCVVCHRPQGNGPFALQTYEQVKRKSAKIKDVLRDRRMPPWLADGHYSKVMDEPTISDVHRSLVIWWIDHGMEEGRAATASVAPSGPALPPADVVLKAPQHTITSDDDTYQCFVLDPGLKADAYVNAISFQTSNVKTIHHIMMYLDTDGVLDGKSGSWDCLRDGIVNKLVPIDSWSKGMRLTRYSDDFGYRFPRGSKILLQTHYGDHKLKGQVEQTTVGLYLRPTPPLHEIKWEILSQFDIAIPPDARKTETIKFHVAKDMSVLGLVPHLHHVGRLVDVYMVTPDQKKVNLLRINEWVYLWQTRYMFRQPIKAPKGSTIYMHVVYDNTTSNPNQPNNPLQAIRYDVCSNQEMLVLALFYADYLPGDEQRSLGALVH